MTAANAVDLSTIVGRIVAALRQEQGASQTTLAGRMTWDRSLLARIEAGRNTANVDNLFELEEVFMADRLIERHGDLLELSARVVHEAKRRGIRTLVGRIEKPEDQEPIEPAVLDRIVARTVDDWLVKAVSEPKAEPEPEPEPEPPRRRRR